MNIVIVDCQNDFCEGGTLAVKGANKAIDNIVSYVKKNLLAIKAINFTMDFHPFNHCSFKEYGGDWPSHCINYTYGACLHQKLIELIDYIQDYNSQPSVGEGHIVEINFTPKGRQYNIEEYGAFKGKHFIENFGFSETVIMMGIAGDYCVLETSKNIIKCGYNVEFFLDGIASIDGGKKLNDFIKKQEENFSLTIKNK